jgi:hypothetical protein
MGEIVKEKLSDDVLEGATGGGGILHVTLTDKDSGGTQRITIKTGKKKIGVKP